MCVRAHTHSNTYCVVLQAHNDAVAGSYEKAKKESWTVWAIVSLAILIDLLIILIVVTVKTA